MKILGLNKSKAESKAMLITRILLGVLFLWLGLLKISGYLPYFEVQEIAFPYLTISITPLILGVGEAAIGLLLLIHKLKPVTLLLVVAHLVATLTIIIFDPNILFTTTFPLLSYSGEILLRNIIFSFVAFIILFSEQTD